MEGITRGGRETERRNTMGRVIGGGTYSSNERLQQNVPEQFRKTWRGGGKERGTTDRGAGRVKLGRGGWGHKAGKGGEGEGWLEGYGINCHSDSEISQVGKVSAVCECVSVGAAGGPIDGAGSWADD